MSVQKEVAVRSVFVLAHSRFHQRRVFHRRQTLLQMFAHLAHALCADKAIAGLQIEALAVFVACNLDPAVLNIGHSVKLIAMVQPNRHGRRPELVSRRWSEVENLLPCGKDSLGKEIRENLRQPRAARKNKTLSGDIFSSTSLKVVQMSTLAFRRDYCVDDVIHPGADRIFEYCRHRPPRQKDSALRFEDADGNSM